MFLVLIIFGEVDIPVIPLLLKTSKDFGSPRTLFWKSYNLAQLYLPKYPLVLIPVLFSPLI
jgi:hypothetical protein